MTNHEGMPSEEQIEGLRNQLDSLTEQAIDEMFRIQPNGTNPFNTTFDEREQMTEIIIKRIETFLLATHADWDPRLEKIGASVQWQCPRCDQLCDRAVDDDGKPISEQIELQGKRGKIPMEAALFYCASCRRRFSPLQDAFGAGD